MPSLSKEMNRAKKTLAAGLLALPALAACGVIGNDGEKTIAVHVSCPEKDGEVTATIDEKISTSMSKYVMFACVNQDDRATAPESIRLDDSTQASSTNTVVIETEYDSDVSPPTAYQLNASKIQVEFVNDSAENKFDISRIK